jgi:cytidylate kinase
LAKEIEERDRRDTQRSVAPLKMADDAVLVDTSDMSIGEAIARCLALPNA